MTENDDKLGLVDGYIFYKHNRNMGLSKEVSERSAKGLCVDPKIIPQNRREWCLKGVNRAKEREE